jgi:hypothetical protein
MSQPALFDMITADQPAQPKARRAQPRTGTPTPAVTTSAAPAGRSWTLQLPAPTTTIKVTDPKTKQKRKRIVAGWLTMNDRMYWRKRATLVSAWRELAAEAALAAGLRAGHLTRARFDAELHFVNPARRDTSNWHPTVKACIDALTKGTRTHPGLGIMPDDSPQYLHCEDCPHLRRCPTRMQATPGGPLGLLVLTITELPEVPDGH